MVRRRAPFPGRRCPHCHEPADDYTPLEAGTEPADGSLNVCLSCEGVSVCEAGGLRLPTPAEAVEFGRSPDVARARAVVALAKAAPKGPRPW